jgi:hypothetical protein
MSTCGRDVRAVHSIHIRWATAPGRAEAPVPGGTGASEAATAAGFFVYRQRIDMTRPRIIAPKPMPKFHAPMDTMNGMRSPAT